MLNYQMLVSYRDATLLCKPFFIVKHVTWRVTQCWISCFDLWAVCLSLRHNLSVMLVMVAGTKTSKSVIAITVTIATKNIQYVFERDTIFRDVIGLEKNSFRPLSVCDFLFTARFQAACLCIWKPQVKEWTAGHYREIRIREFLMLF